MYKGVGQAFPSKSEIENCAISNDDGFAIMWNYKGKVQNFRTLDEKKFLKVYSKISKMDPAQTACVVHCRIKTHGSENVKNCHCWIDKGTGIGFAHNGVLSISNRGDMTDSETFFRDLFIPAYKYGGWPAGERAIEACIGTSKFAFLLPDGTIRAYGQYQQNDDGIKYSNGSWKGYAGSSLCGGKSYYGGSSYAGGGSSYAGKGYSYYGDWYDEDDYDAYPSSYYGRSVQGLSKDAQSSVDRYTKASEFLAWLKGQEWWDDLEAVSIPSAKNYMWSYTFSHLDGKDFIKEMVSAEWARFFEPDMQRWQEEIDEYFNSHK